MEHVLAQLEREQRECEVADPEVLGAEANDAKAEDVESAETEKTELRTPRSSSPATSPTSPSRSSHRCLWSDALTAPSVASTPSSPHGTSVALTASTSSPQLTYVARPRSAADGQRPRDEAKGAKAGVKGRRPRHGGCRNPSPKGLSVIVRRVQDESRETRETRDTESEKRKDSEKTHQTHQTHQTSERKVVRKEKKGREVREGSQRARKRDVTDVTDVCDLSPDFSGSDSDSDSRGKSPKISQCSAGSGPSRSERPEGPAPGASPASPGASPASKGVPAETQTSQSSHLSHLQHSHSGSPRSAQMTQMPQIPQSLSTSVSETQLSEDAVSMHESHLGGVQERHRQSERDLENSPGASARKVPKTERQIPSEPSGDETSPWWCNREGLQGHNGDVEDEGLSMHQAWQGAQDRGGTGGPGWGWRSLPLRDLPEPPWSDVSDVPLDSECMQWPWLQNDVEDIEPVDPCSPRRPGTRQGRRGKERQENEATSLWMDESSEAQGWADFVNRQTWDGSDSEEEQLFAIVGHTTIMAQDFLESSEPELEVQGFAPRDLWVVFECEEEREEEMVGSADVGVGFEEDYQKAESSISEVEDPEAKETDSNFPSNPLVEENEAPNEVALKYESEDPTWANGKCLVDGAKCVEMLFQASESDDTAETECMSSLAPTEYDKGLQDDDDDDHNESEIEDVPGIVAVLDECQTSGKVEDGAEKEDEAWNRSESLSGEPKAFSTAASLLQAVYRGRLERLELFRACAAGTPANWRSLRLRTETAMARSAQEEVAARILQAAWRGFLVRKVATEPLPGDAQMEARRDRCEDRSEKLSARSKDIKDGRDERGRDRMKPRPPAGKAAPGPRRRADTQAMSEEGDDVHDETDRQERTRQRPHSSKSSGLSDRPPRGSSRGDRRRPSVSELLSQMQDVPIRTSAAGGLPRLGLCRSDSRHRTIPAPSCARAESPRSTPNRARRGALTTLASPRRSWG